MAVVDNSAQNIGSQTNATLLSNVYYFGTHTRQGTYQISIVEPELVNTISTVVHAHQPQAGDIMHYSIDVHHNTITSDAPAYQVRHRRSTLSSLFCSPLLLIFSFLLYIFDAIYPFKSSAYEI